MSEVDQEIHRVVLALRREIQAAIEVVLIQASIDPEGVEPPPDADLLDEIRDLSIECTNAVFAVIRAIRFPSHRVADLWRNGRSLERMVERDG